MRTGQAVAQAMRQILDAAGVWACWSREPAGEPARRAGNEYLFLELSGKLVESFEATLVERDCHLLPLLHHELDKITAKSLPDAQLGIEVMHHTEFIKEVLPTFRSNP